jgi:hypothetical protein
VCIQCYMNLTEANDTLTLSTLVQSCYITSYVTLLNYSRLLKWEQEYLQRLQQPLCHDMFGELGNGKGKVVPALG